MFVFFDYLTMFFNWAVAKRYSICIFRSRVLLGIMSKCLSKCHISLSLVLLVLASLADYVSYRVNTVRMHGLAECCAFYFIVMGVIGIFGSASHRRGLIIAFMLMGLHGVIIFAPMIIIASSFDIHFYKRECWGSCDWHLLSASIPKNSRCQILCGDNIDSNQKSSMSRLGTDYRLDAGLITLAIMEMLLSLATTALCFKEVFGWRMRKAKEAVNVGNAAIAPQWEHSGTSSSATQSQLIVHARSYI